MVMTTSESSNESVAAPHTIAVRALFLRVRFLLAIALLAALMAAWPWMRTVWERVVLGPISSGGNDAVSIDSEFFCPMDPGIHSAWPSICPICNMDLIVRKKTDAMILPEGMLARMQLSPYRVQLAGVRTEGVQTHPDHANSLTIPASAVVHRDSGPIVYVETMAGMYDALPVVLGDKQNDQYEILSGLQAGQKVVSAGAFLIDAETRLNPSLAVQYFGANRHHASSTAPALAERRIAKASERCQLLIKR